MLGTMAKPAKFLCPVGRGGPAPPPNSVSTVNSSPLRSITAASAVRRSASFASSWHDEDVGASHNNLGNTQPDDDGRDVINTIPALASRTIMHLRLPRPTTGDNSHRLSTATAATGLLQRLPFTGVDNQN